MKAAAMTETTSETTKAPSPRRKFLGWLWACLGLAAVAEICWIGMSFLLFRRERSAASKTARLVVAGPVDRFQPETVTAIPEGGVYLARLASGGFLALSRTCTHLGCSINWDEKTGRFACPCHGSTFDLTGAVLTPPAPRPLDIYPVRIEDGVVKIDVASRRRRNRYDPGQATRIES